MASTRYLKNLLSSKVNIRSQLFIYNQLMKPRVRYEIKNTYVLPFLTDSLSYSSTQKALFRTFSTNGERFFSKSKFSTHVSASEKHQKILHHERVTDKNVFRDKLNSLSFDERKELLIKQAIEWIDSHISGYGRYRNEAYDRYFDDVLVFEVFMQKLIVSNTVEDLKNAYSLVSDLLLGPGSFQAIFELLILNNNKLRESHNYYHRYIDTDYHFVSADAVIKKYQDNIKKLREVISQIVGEITSNEIWLPIRPDAKKLEYMQVELKKIKTETELAKILFDNFLETSGNSSHANMPTSFFQRWGDIKYSILNFHRKPHQSNSIINSVGKLLFSILEPRISSEINPIFPENDIQLLCNIEWFTIQYDIDNDDERHTCERYYRSVYGNEVSNNEIRKQILIKLKQEAFSRDNDSYESFIASRRQYYKEVCLDPANWYPTRSMLHLPCYVPIPDNIYSEIISNYELNRIAKGLPHFSNQDRDLVNSFLKKIWANGLTLNNCQCNLDDLLGLADDAKVHILNILNHNESQKGISYIFSNFSSFPLNKLEREKYIQLVFSELGVSALNENIFNVEEALNLSGDKFNELFILLNKVNNGKNDDWKSEIQQLFFNNEHDLDQYNSPKIR